MCGIFCSVTSKTDVQHPVVVEGRYQDGSCLFWETSDATFIENTFITKSRECSSQLSEIDKKKLSHVQELRELNERLNKLKNTIKVSSEAAESRRAIESRIQEITYDESHDDLSTTSGSKETNTTIEDFMSLIATRGPDYLSYSFFRDASASFQLVSSVLSLRQPFTQQPLELDELSLQFNGELYNEECLATNDTDYIKSLLGENMARLGRKDGILRTVISLYGEFAFTIIDKRDKLVYFGRDVIGRRSLLYSYDERQKSLCISSLPPSSDSDFQECKGNELMIYDYRNNALETRTYSQLFKNYDMEPYLGLVPTTDSCESDSILDQRIEELHAKLATSCDLRISTVHPLHPDSENYKVGVLFSGGLDCTVLAAMLCEQSSKLPKLELDLVTVGFENSRTNTKASSTPDRKLSKLSWFHLSKLFSKSNVEIRLVEIDVSYEQWLLHRKKVMSLMFPRNTEMDLSIAIAFYFASGCFIGRKSVLRDNSVSWNDFQAQEDQYLSVDDSYMSNSKVLFSGLGADELFAGYSRHEALFNDLMKPDTQEYDSEIKKRNQSLALSLIHDINIIYERNLGRDDRVVSSWGKELRYPYLDEKLISFVVSTIEPNLKLKISWETVNSKKKGVLFKAVATRKWILRQLAKRMGLAWVQNEPKRAIQFGVKSAKMEIGQNKVKGTDKL
ncbi:Piso0_002109 [Millerozyma farinosa CBS 7064]|uniref:Piso0_002109 protein n=1 Tax=Pichia sorbitophila (strain ATCC MYA-4447 / BCRC 22081 / CBS 7064 / NBRC 10061 / NRRL Y-12695) TaxID=559304 RepID=G8YBQ4_PICSO|nr:Piso0_002109 [Millerozyma farinosa CBS 7064]